MATNTMSRQRSTSRNPVLNDRVFSTSAASDSMLSGVDLSSIGSSTTTTAKAMSVEGTARISILLIGLTAAAGVFGWGRVGEIIVPDSITGGSSVSVDFSPVWIFAPMIVGFIAVLVGMFEPKLAAPASIVYALAEGVALGAISHVYDARYNGIVVQAILATAAVFVVMMVLYSTKILRPTPKMVKVVMAATFGIMITYAIGWIGSMFGADLRFWNQAGPLGIGISLVIVAVAAFNLLLDFDFIERGAAQRLPRSYEWVGALGLLVTLVWLYLELLRLLSKLRD